MVVGEWTVLHNGIITNETALRSVLSIDDLATAESDTAVIAALFDAWDRNGRSEPIETVLGRLEGEYSIIALSTGGDVVASSNVGNLYRLDDGDTVLLVSEPRQLPRGSAEQATRLPLGEVVTLRERDGQLRSIAAKNVRPAARQSAGATGLHLEESAIPLEFKERIVALNERDLRECSATPLHSVHSPRDIPGHRLRRGRRVQRVRVRATTYSGLMRSNGIFVLRVPWPHGPRVSQWWP